MIRPTVLTVAAVGILLSTCAEAATSCEAPKLRQGSRYSAARKTVLKAGFQAPTPPAYGYSDKGDRGEGVCTEAADICNRYPEIDTCSGQGQCLMNFKDVYGNVLSISTYGDISNGSATVTGFEIKCNHH